VRAPWPQKMHRHPCQSAPLLVFAEHPDQHRPERPILFTVDQEFAEGARLGVAPVRADSVDPIEVREHEDVEQLEFLG
jgi:hypothetical protein